MFVTFSAEKVSIEITFLPIEIAFLFISLSGQEIRKKKKSNGGELCTMRPHPLSCQRLFSSFTFWLLKNISWNSFSPPPCLLSRKQDFVGTPTCVHSSLILAGCLILKECREPGSLGGRYLLYQILFRSVGCHLYWNLLPGFVACKYTQASLWETTVLKILTDSLMLFTRA